MFFYIYGHNYGRQTDALPQGASPDSGTEAVGLIFTRIWRNLVVTSPIFKLIGPNLTKM